MGDSIFLLGLKEGFGSATDFVFDFFAATSLGLVGGAVLLIEPVG
jgi:hypothetical protein